VRRLQAAAGSVVFLVVAPGVVAGLVPWLLTDWRSAGPPVAVALVGLVCVTLGIGVLLLTFGRFVMEGRGTPAPVAPTERLVVGGLYRYVRNPMYLAVAATIAGQALLLGRPLLLAYAAAFWLVVASFVRSYEEPTLSARYGDEYAAYRSAVPAWWPRLRPWSPKSPRHPGR
jgi:protein-S-isoprenylcysteine O-methyltransferase Ste14